jgi:hypothetical protein
MVGNMKGNSFEPDTEYKNAWFPKYLAHMFMDERRYWKSFESSTGFQSINSSGRRRRR